MLIEAQIVAGRCELHPEKQPECVALLANASCAELVARDSRGELMEACSELLRCRGAERAPQ